MSAGRSIALRWVRRRRTLVLLGGVVLGWLWFSVLLAPPATSAPDGCGGLNPVACENLQPGTDPSQWDIAGAGDPTLQGFATEISVNRGERVDFKISTTASAYRVEIYRLGWYQGNGARFVGAVEPSAALPQPQPACVTQPTLNLVDCGTWAVSASWTVPDDAVSGVFVARLVRPDTGGASHIPFVVRDDASHADVLFQTSDTTWQAYNTYGGANFYPGELGRAAKLSYNRPFSTRGLEQGRDYLFANEFPMIRFLERNGYDVSYLSGVDTDRRGGLLRQHKVFLSVGHDEYWSGTQRANVEAARDAGVNLAFFSGNEVYWKTRYEPSVDGSTSDYRTLVCYKETWDNAKSDPSAEWTGTWRDPRFSPPSNGAEPENALTGTAYMSNSTDLPLTVSATEGRLRLWRSTTAADQEDGASMELAPHTVGYESDEDLDNDVRPEGLVRLSTTEGPTPQYLRDYGNTVTPGTTTHHVTMYRAASGALVFSAGTIQWAWGLDAVHDGTQVPASPVMQQATVNLLADMHVQPSTTMDGITAATGSGDREAPTVAFTSPTQGTEVTNGERVAVTGTAADTGGGAPAGVELSTDNGSTWHPAQGTTSWSYTYVQHGNGPVTVLARATDDSLNTGEPTALTLKTACPCTLFGEAVPATLDSGDGAAVELGMRFQTDVDGWITAIRFHKAAGNTGTHVGRLWSATGQLLAQGTFTAESPTGWQTVVLPAPIEVQAGVRYVASYSAPVGHYSLDPDFFRSDYRSDPLTAPARTETSGNGVYGSLGAFPTQSHGTPNYGVDVVYTDADTVAPVGLSPNPVDGASSVPTSIRPTIVMSEPVEGSSLHLTLTADSGADVAGASSYAASSMLATFTPEQPLANDTTYWLTATAEDLHGNASTNRVTTFRTALADQTPGTCPCTVWDDAVSPAVRDYADPSPTELGMRFTAQVDGIVTGVRFYKGVGNAGPHTGSLWNAAGTRLATAVFTDESTEGWQQLTFAHPVPLTAGTTYVASYTAPYGHYAVDRDLLNAVGLQRDPLQVPVRGGAYTPGAGFPATPTGNSYAVQPVFTVPAGAAPHVASTTPSDGTTNVRVDRPLTATFDTLLQPGTAQIALAGPTGEVAGSVTFDAGSRTATFLASAPLVAGTDYALTISGARSLGGAAMAPVVVRFTTAGQAACPCTAFSSTESPAVADARDAAAVTLGLRFVPAVSGQVTGIRFYKSVANTGTHTGSLWSVGGQRLATGTFVNESATGWQTLTFAEPVDVTAGQTYVASYYAPDGHYAADLETMSQGWATGPLQIPGGSNGVYTYGADAFPTSTYRSTNYWVDVVFGRPSG